MPLACSMPSYYYFILIVRDRTSQRGGVPRSSSRERAELIWVCIHQVQNANFFKFAVLVTPLVTPPTPSMPVLS